MPMEEDLVARLTGDAAVAAIVGQRVSWFGRQRGDGFPALVLSKISPGREWTHDGPDELDRPRVQIDAYSDDPDEALALSRAVRAEMETTADVGDTRFHPAMIDTDQLVDDGELDGGQPLFRAVQDYQFYHEEI